MPHHQLSVEFVQLGFTAMSLSGRGSKRSRASVSIGDLEDEPLPTQAPTSPASPGTLFPAKSVAGRSANGGCLVLLRLSFEHANSGCVVAQWTQSIRGFTLSDNQVHQP